MFPEIRDSQLEDDESPLYNEVNIRVPWLVYNKKLVPATSYVDDLSSGVDLMPTILDMVGVDYDPKKFDGRSVYRNEKNGAVVVTLGYNREGIVLVEENLKFKFNYLTNSGVLYRKREPKINSRNDRDLRNRVADWTERALLWEKLTAGVRRGRTPTGLSR